MAAAKSVKQNDRPITSDPTLGLIVVQHQPVAIEKRNRVLDRLILWLATSKKIRPQGLQMR